MRWILRRRIGKRSEVYYASWSHDEDDSRSNRADTFRDGGCSALRPADPLAYHVTAVQTLSGQDSHVSDANTFLITARGPHSVIHAEGYRSIETGTDLCRYGDLAYPKTDSTKPCAGNFTVNFQNNQFHIISVTEAKP